MSPSMTLSMATTAAAASNIAPTPSSTSAGGLAGATQSPSLPLSTTGVTPPSTGSATSTGTEIVASATGSNASAETASVHVDESKAGMTCAILNTVGRMVTVYKHDGHVYQGVFCGTPPPGAPGSGSPDTEFTLRYVTLIHVPSTSKKSGADVGARERVRFSWSEVERVLAAGAGGPDGFAFVPQEIDISASARTTPPVKSAAGAVDTDKSISRSQQSKPSNGASNYLKPAGKEWLESPAPDSASMAASSTGAFDQFAVNEKNFGIKSTYHEELYTTPLDRSLVSAQDNARAERIARAIESSSSSNAHLAEERGQIRAKRPDDAGVELDDDEEAKYGAVVGSGAYASAASGGVAKYRPPQKRGDGSSGPTTTKSPSPPPAEGSAAAASKPATASGASWASIAKGPQAAATSAAAAAKPADAASQSAKAKLAVAALPARHMDKGRSPVQHPVLSKDEQIEDFKKFSEKLQLGSSPSGRTPSKSKQAAASAAQTANPMATLVLPESASKTAEASTAAAKTEEKKPAAEAPAPVAASEPAASAAASEAKPEEKPKTLKKLNPNAKVFPPPAAPMPPPPMVNQQQPHMMGQMPPHMNPMMGGPPRRYQQQGPAGMVPMANGGFIPQQGGYVVPANFMGAYAGMPIPMPGGMYQPQWQVGPVSPMAAQQRGQYASYQMQPAGNMVPMYPAPGPNGQMIMTPMVQLVPTMAMPPPTSPQQHQVAHLVPIPPPVPLQPMPPQPILVTVPVAEIPPAAAIAVAAPAPEAAPSAAKPEPTP